MGPWIVLQRLKNGVTYRIQDIALGTVRQVPREKLKVIGLRATSEPNTDLPRVIHAEDRSAVESPQIASPEEQTLQDIGPGDEFFSFEDLVQDSQPGQTDTTYLPPPEVETEDQQPLQTARRYSLRPVPDRLSREAEKRRRRVVRFQT